MSATALPGRLGNLTAEQNARLQDMWLATLKVFGVHAPGGIESNSLSDSAGTGAGNAASRTQNTQSPRTDTLGSNKKSKKRIHLFGRKQRAETHDDDDEILDGGHTVLPNDGTSMSDADDKYGQNKDFAHALASQSPESLRRAFWSMVKHDHPDGLLLRFLRARKWDVEKALVMLVSTMHWRMQEMHVDDDIIRSGEGGAIEATKSANPAKRKAAEDFLAQLRMGKSFLHGTDREGRPMCFVRVRLHRQGEQSEASLERYTVFVIETARMLLAPPVETAAVIFDMTNFSMANMDYGPVKFMIKCFEANYPESLGAILVHKSPWVFHGMVLNAQPLDSRAMLKAALGIWNIIKGWLDPVVAGKVHFTKSVEELEHFISRNHIPKELGGDEDWTYEYIEPRPDENTRMLDGAATSRLLGGRESSVKDFERATLAWVSSKAAMDERQALEERREGLAASLRSGYWKLDPYIRARSIYDRNGLIMEGGLLDFYPNASRNLNGSTIIASTSGIPRPEPHADDVD